MNKKLLEQRAEDFIRQRNAESEGLYTHANPLSVILADFATEETKLLSEHILELQKTNGSLTDRVNELFNTLSTECQERQELVDEYEKENKEAREIIGNLLQLPYDYVDVLTDEMKEDIKRAEQFLGE